MNSKLIEVNEITDIVSFLKSIEWSKEYWLIFVAIFHIGVSVLSFVANLNVQIIIFMGLLLLVYFSEYLNEVAAENSHRFSQQQYFDASGLFISIIFCCPILINCIFILARWLMMSFDLMKSLKKAQLRQEARRRKEQSQLVGSSSHGKNE